MLIDPLLRFNWIPYVLLPGELQHSAILSFIVALSEIVRRGIWALIRVENEHMNNIGMFRASKDPSLPYTEIVLAKGSDNVEEEVTDPTDLRSPVLEQGTISHDGAADRRARTSTKSTAAQTPRYRPDNLEAQVMTGGAPMSKQTAARTSAVDIPPTPQSGMRRVASAIGGAHAQDFERRKDRQPATNDARSVESSDEEEEEEEEEEVTDSEEAARREGHTEQHPEHEHDDAGGSIHIANGYESASRQ